MIDEQTEQNSDGQQTDDDVLRVLASRLGAQAEEQVRARQIIEDRMLQDYTLYQGQYDTAIQGDGSKLFVNITRNKTTAGEARLSDMIFPTDDRNWGISETPVPTLVKAIDTPKPVSTAQGKPIPGPEGKQLTTGDLAAQVNKQASKAAEAMTLEIDDQLTEANYSAVARNVIHEAAVLGTSVIKGPILTGQVKQAWVKDDAGEYSMQVMESIVPTTEHVSVWNFFPDMSAATMTEAEFVFERQYLTKKMLRSLLKLEDTNKPNIKRVLATQPDDGPEEAYLNDLRCVTAGDTTTNKNKYKMWLYYGPISVEDLQSAGAPGMDEFAEDDDNPDEVTGCVWFVGNHVIKAYINPLESDDIPYSVFNWEKDDSSIFGFGIPYLMAGPQSIINGTWRMMMDNAGLCTGPQIVVDRDLVEPADGTWGLTARKLWYKKRKDMPITNAFATFNIASHQAEMQQIYTMARQLADEETSLPLIAQGETGSHVTDTASGMSLLMNSANIVLRRAVKNWDDDITTPLITRFYDWNMQFSERDEIKGDYSVVARGSSHLLVKETQAKNAALLFKMAMAPPVAGITNFESAYEKVITSMQHDPDEWIKPKEEREKDKQPPPELQIQMKQMQMDEARLKMEAQDKAATQQLNAAELKQDGELNMLKLQSEREIAMAGMSLEERKIVQDGQFKARSEMIKTESEERSTAAAARAENIRSSVQLKEIQRKDKELLFKMRSGRQGI